MKYEYEIAARTLVWDVLARQGHDADLLREEVLRPMLDLAEDLMIAVINYRDHTTFQKSGASR